jgi:hypothetical protein
MCLLYSIRSGGNAGLHSSQLKNDFLLSYWSEHFQYSDFIRGITFTREYAIWSGGAPELLVQFPYLANLGRLYSGREDIASGSSREVHGVHEMYRCTAIVQAYRGTGVLDDYRGSTVIQK